MTGKITLYVLDIKRGVHDNKPEEYKERLEKELEDGVITQQEFDEILEAFNDHLQKIKNIKK